MRSLALALVLMVGMPATATPAGSMVEASGHHRRGMLHFELGQYREALAEFEQAYQLSPHPLLLFNIAQAQRLAGDRERALATYQAFLEAVPDAPNRADVQGFVVELSRPPEPVRAAPVLTLVPPSSDHVTTRALRAQPQPLYKKWWLWTSVGATVVIGAVVIGVVVGGHGPTASLGVIDVRH